MIHLFLEKYKICINGVNAYFLGKNHVKLMSISKLYFVILFCFYGFLMTNVPSCYGSVHPSKEYRIGFLSNFKN
jgi:hypothetical protein